MACVLAALLIMVPPALTSGPETVTVEAPAQSIDWNVLVRLARLQLVENLKP